MRSAIQQIALEHRRRYGYRRITAEHRRGMQVNHKRVVRIMLEDNLLGLQAVRPHPWEQIRNKTPQIASSTVKAAPRSVSSEMWVYTSALVLILEWPNNF